MKIEDARKIIEHMKAIQDILDTYSDDEYKSICVDLSTDEVPNFFVSTLDDLTELGLPLQAEWFGGTDVPYVIWATLNGFEIHSICNIDELLRLGLPIPVKPDWEI